MKKFLSFLITVAMVFGLVPFSLPAFAENEVPMVFYVKHGATGDGLTDQTPGSFATVIATINQNYGAGDTVTVKIVKGNWDDVASTTSDKLGSVYHASMADIPEHEATIILTSLDPSNPSRLAWKNDYQTENNKGTNINLTGPTVLKDIKMVDSRINHYWCVYTRGHSLKVDTGVVWKNSSYNADTDIFTFEGKNAVPEISGASRSDSDPFTFSSPVILEFADNCFGNFTFLAFAGYNASKLAVFEEDFTYRLGTGTAKKVIVDNMDKSSTFKKNVNLVLNGTTVKSLINEESKTTATLPVIEGAFQIIRNNGATATNSVTGFKDTSRTTPCDIYDITVETGAVLDVTSVAGKYSVDSTSLVYAQSEDRKTAWYSKDGYITITKPGTYTVKTAASVDVIKAALATPEASSLYVFDSWSDDSNGTITAKLVETNYVFYVSASGSDTNTGKSASAPFATLKKAMEALGSYEGTVAIIGSYSPTASDYTNHTQNINIVGYDKTSVFDSSKAAISFGGPVTFKDITYTRGTNSYILSRGHDITFGEGFNTTSTDDWMVFGNGQNTTSVNDINVTVMSGNFTGKFNVGGIMPKSGYTVNNDANINVSGGSVANIILGSTNWGSCGATTFAKSVVLQHDGGTVTKITATATGNGSPTTITGSLIVINNNGATAPAYDTSLDSISIGSKYYINSGDGGYVKPVTDADGNAVAGKFLITIDDDANKSAMIVNGGSRTFLSESGEITLQEGTTEITYANYPPNPGTTIPMTWKDMDKGYITLIFDDVRADFPTIFEIVSKEYNLPLCAAVPSNNIKNAPETLHELQDRGGEILSHTKSHLVIKPFETSWADVETQLGDSYRILTQEGFNVNGIILAGGTGQIAQTDTEYRGLIELVTNKYYKYSDKYGLSTQYWKQRNWFSERTLDQLKSIVDTHAANKTWEVIYGHDLTEVSAENLRAFCEYLVKLQDEGKIKVVTYKYMHENFGDWESPVDFGDTTYTVEFYGSDKKTLVEKQVIVEGEDAKTPTQYVLAEGYTLSGWDGNLENVDNNRKVYAVCKDLSGNTVGTDVDSVITPPPYVAPTLFYIDSTNGSDSNKGTSVASPLASVNKAIELADSDNPFEVKIIGSYQLPTTINAHGGMLTISGYDSTSEIYTVQSGGYSIKGDITLKNIKFTNGLYAWVSMCGNKFIVGENVTISGSHQIALGGNYSTKGTSAYAKVSSGTWNKLELGPIAAGSGHTVSSDAFVHIDGGTVNNLVLGTDGWSLSHQGVTFEKNILVKQDGGTVKTIKTFTNNYASTFNGALMFIFNNGTKPQAIDSTVKDALSAGQYYVYSEAGGYVDFAYHTDGSSKTGVIKVIPDEGNYATVTNGETKTMVFETTEVTLSAGTTEITYGNISDIDTIIKVTDGEKEHAYFPYDTVNITHAGTIKFPSELSKDGFIFGGWYSDSGFTSPVKDGSNVTVGTIYARWIAISEDSFGINGLQIRISGVQGLRFITKFDHELRSQIISLNSENAVLDPTNTSFNKSADIGYGSVVLPEKYLGGAELCKNGVYSINKKTYYSKTAPAANTLKTETDHDLYTVCIIGMAQSNYICDYAARPYITYLDASGTKHTVYGDVYSNNLYAIADRIYKEDAINEPEQERENILTYLYENILSKVDGMENALPNTYRALNNDKKLTIGYIGGSITYGSSAAKLVNSDGTVSAAGGNIEDSYVNRTTAWFKENYPDVSIEAINAGISDTATNFGIYRLKDHLMNENGHDMPDLVFVEFTVNDWTYNDGISQDAGDLSRQAESLVRNIYAANPYADIVFVFSARSLTGTSRMEYVKVAEEYGIPYVDMGVPMQTLMTERGASNEADGTYYYTVDNLHPSAKGYEVYFGEIKKLLTANLYEDAVYYAPKYNYAENMPSQINRSLWLEPAIIPASEFTVSGTVNKWTGLSSQMYGTTTTSSAVSVTPDSIFIKGTDAQASFTFTGTSFGLIFGMNSSGFDIDYQIDGHGWKKAEVDEDLLSFQKYAHTQLIVFEQELAYGEHTIELKFNATSDGAVNVQIGGAAVSGVDNGMSKIFALTIDDGPKVVASNQILDVLGEYGAHATFFVVGTSCNDTTKEVLNRMLAEGCEIGNHSNRWTGIAELTKNEVLDDYNACQNKVYSLTGYYPVVYRAPGLSMSETAFSAIPVPVMGGYSIGADWDETTTYETRLTNLRNAIGDGRVVLIHDQEANVPVLEIVIREAINQGYKIVTASELIKLRGYGLTPYEQIQHKEFAK